MSIGFPEDDMIDRAIADMMTCNFCGHGESNYIVFGNPSDDGISIMYGWCGGCDTRGKMDDVNGEIDAAIISYGKAPTGVPGQLSN